MDFLSVFYSMYGPILYGFPHIARYWSGGITKFICPTCIHCPHSGWPRQYFAKMFNTGKLEWWGCRVLKKVWWYGKPCWYSTGTVQMNIWTEFLYQCRTSALLCSCSCFVLLSLCHSEINLQTELLRQLHWLPIAERVTYKLCLLVHNAAVGRAPAYITDLLQPAATTSSRSSLQAASRRDYVVPRTNQRLTDRAFSTAASWAWNQLPTYLKMTLLTPAFRRGLKTSFPSRLQLQTRRALSGAHVPPTKVFRLLTGSVNKTIVKPRVAAAANMYMSDFPDVKFCVPAQYDSGESDPIPASGL